MDFKYSKFLVYCISTGRMRMASIYFDQLYTAISKRSKKWFFRSSCDPFNQIWFSKWPTIQFNLTEQMSPPSNNACKNNDSFLEYRGFDITYKGTNHNYKYIQLIQI